MPEKGWNGVNAKARAACNRSLMACINSYNIHLKSLRWELIKSLDHPFRRVQQSVSLRAQVLLDIYSEPNTPMPTQTLRSALKKPGMRSAECGVPDSVQGRRRRGL